jgi:hypothetical protein
MQKLSEILRLISLAILFGGSAVLVFTVIVLVKSQEAQGILKADAAAANAPAFFQYAKVLAGAAVALLVSEGLSWAAVKQKTKLTFARMGASLLCIISAFIFSFAIVPPMSELQPQIKTDQVKAEEFHKLHETSRAVFGVSILFALVSLIMPVFGTTAVGNKDN